MFLVGTGPGDPGLLTLRAVQLMQRADVVLYDRLVSEDILRLVNPAARMVRCRACHGRLLHGQLRWPPTVHLWPTPLSGLEPLPPPSFHTTLLRAPCPFAQVYVGKQAGYHTATQAEIHELLAEFAGEGGTVVRLKGGDPYVFGR